VRKVPEVTAYFWTITILVSGMGETVADALNTDWHVGVAHATWWIGGTLVLALTAQVTLNRYVPAVYWLAVVPASTVGTLFTDNLMTGFGIPLTVLAAMFTVVVLAVFAVWYAVERTVSIDSVLTIRRESFYWVVVIGTFVLGTVLSELLAEQIGGRLASALIAAAAICGIGVLFYGVNLHATTAFWVVLVLTQSLGASLGDLLSQDGTTGGLAIGATAASMLIGIGVVGLIWFLTASKVDQILPETHGEPTPTPHGGRFWA
jgi:uncharacterized membrane-anchored protein